MYLNFYNLQKQPFHITPDPEFLYLSPSHKEALAAIIYGIKEKKGFIGIIGPVGVGKTTILRSYLERAEKERLKVIYIFNSKLTFEGLLRTIFQEMGLTIETDDVMEMINRLYRVLIEEYRNGNTVVLIVDEAQNMPVDTLESLRMISNLETSKDKLIQIVLAGQTEFEEMLNLDRLRQLKQRMAIRSTILQLTKEESLDYIKFRLQKAGSDTPSVFTPAALKRIVTKANGIPRILNILCDNALITGLGYRQKPVTERIAREIIRDFDGTPRGRKPVRRWVAAALGAAVLLLLAGTLLVFQGKAPGPATSSVPATTESARHDRAPADPRPAETKGLNDERPMAGSAVATATTPSTSPATPAPASTVAPAPVPPQRKAETPRMKQDHAKTGKTITKVVTRGDTLSKLAKDVYGPDEKDTTMNKRLDLVKQSNPQIKDVHVIMPGQKIVFPQAQAEPAQTER